MKEELINQIIELIETLIDETENDDNPEFHYKLMDIIGEFKLNSLKHQEFFKQTCKRIDKIFSNLNLDSLK